MTPWVRLRSASNHPFLYKRMIDEADPAAAPGDVVAVFDKRGALFGHALFNPRSQIALRMLAYGDRPIDDDFWRERISAAIRLRHAALNLGDERTDAYRLVHAEGDGLSGLVVDRYANYLVLEAFSLGIWRRFDQLAGLLTESLGAPGRDGWQVLARADDRAAALEGIPPRREPDTAPESIIVREQGLRFRVDLRHGHKTGFFADQRENRVALADHCAERRVLDLCGYTGGFSIHAAKRGGAADVTLVDLDEAAVAIAKQNANLNQARVHCVHADGFVYLRQMIANAERYDVVVLDPPKLILSAESYADGARRYHDFNALALQVVRSGGLLLTCSCSGLMRRDDFLEILRAAARVAARRIRVLRFGGAAADHPVSLDCPETAYLKAAWLWVE